MENRHFRLVMLLAVVFPLLVSFAGYLYFGSGDDTGSTQPVTSSLQQPDSHSPILIGKAPNAEAPKQEKPLGFKEFSLYLAILAGAITLLDRYLKTSLVWIAVIILPLGFSVLYFGRVGLSLTLFYLPNLIFAALVAVLMRYLFFNRALVRFRMILCSVVGAGFLTLYFRSLYFLAKTNFQPDQWSKFYVSALILFIFVTFGLSLADMVILRSAYKDRLNDRKSEIDADDDNEDDDTDA